MQPNSRTKPHISAGGFSDDYSDITGETIMLDVADTSTTYIYGTVKSKRTGIEGVTVSTNTSISITTVATGFYSFAVTADAFQNNSSGWRIYVNRCAGWRRTRIKPYTGIAAFGREYAAMHFGGPDTDERR